MSTLNEDQHIPSERKRRFIKIYIITNTYNKKIKGTTLMELFPDFVTTAQISGKFVSLMYRSPLPHKMLLVLISVADWVYPIAKVWPKGFYINEEFHWHLFLDNQWCVNVCTTVTLHTAIRYSSSCLTQASKYVHRYFSNKTTQNDSSPNRERPFSHYVNSHNIAAEMWTKMKSNLLRVTNFCIILPICTSFVNTCPKVYM